MRSRWAVMGALALAAAFSGFDCGESSGSSSSALVAPATWTSAGGVKVTVAPSPFALSIADSTGHVLLESSPADPAVDPTSPLAAYAPLAITHDTDESATQIFFGWTNFVGVDDPWKRSTNVTAIDTSSPTELVVHVGTEDPAHPGVTVTIVEQQGGDGTGVHVTASVDGGDPNENRLSFGFVLHDDDHFMGFGERFVYVDRRGLSLYDWVEDDGFGHGEGTPIGPDNPSPNGPSQTHIPIPWFMDPRGFGMLLNTTWRSNYHLGDERADAWRVESTTGAIDMTLFASPDPTKLVSSLTAVTGRPPEIADWLLAPRRRADSYDTEMDKLRAAHIPTSAIDTALHYFPNGDGQDHAAMQATTADIHARGFKAIAYFCPFVADSWTPVFADAAAAGYLVKHADGTTYTVLDPPYNAGMVDFTNPAAVTWFQSYMQGALDDGWDGWMYDFAEYVPPDAVMFDGRSGAEVHNEYPVLYQQAALDLLQQQRPGNFLFFARSGYSGTSGSVPMTWAGDQSTDFDLADGLPAALCGALNLGMSGVPLWGSDISGYHYIYNPPPDKEVYLRWTELGAFSADMHDENNGAGTLPSSARWQIWDDQESQDVYRKYASIKTRMIPYVQVAVAEARASGLPVMRHLYLSYPLDPHVYAIQDEYLFGDWLLVAPVVQRDARARSVYLPEAQYFDFWTGARVTGGGNVIVSADLDDAPVFARVGAIVPMLSEDVETVFPSADGGVVSAQDRADFLEVEVFAGGTTSLQLADGTLLSQSAPTSAFDAGTGAMLASGAPIVAAGTAADLMTCAACFLDDPATHVFAVAVETASETINAGPLSVSVSGSPSVKRYLFTVRH